MVSVSTGSCTTSLSHPAPPSAVSVSETLLRCPFSSFIPWGRPDAVVLVSPSMFAGAVTMLRI